MITHVYTERERDTHTHTHTQRQRQRERELSAVKAKCQRWLRWRVKVFNPETKSYRKHNARQHSCYKIWSGQGVVDHETFSSHVVWPSRKLWLMYVIRVCRERWEMGHLPCRNVPLPTFYHDAFGRSKSDGTSVITEIRRKDLSSRIPPFKVTQGHRNRHGSIGYLWLPISDP